MATLTRRLFNVDDYHRMAEAGILLEDDRVELIEGELIEMAAIGNRHNAAVDRLTELFVERLQRRAIVRVQGSVRLNERNEPQPDLVILRRRDDFYENAPAGPGDTLLVVEVADSSLDFDREIKAPLYARNGVHEFWLVDLEARMVTAFREPTASGYQSAVAARPGESVAPSALPDVSIAVEEVMPGF
jgi:Uma2 family endonuclease